VNFYDNTGFWWKYCKCWYTGMAYGVLNFNVFWRSSFEVKLFNSVERSFTVMAPVRQKRRELCEEKFSKPLQSGLRQLSLEINSFVFQHSTSRHH
jgi:hypothetical protein